MRAALISPTEYLNAVQPFSDYHLLLTHKVIYDRGYCDYYRERSRKGDFILLDNSALEKSGRAVPMKDIALAALLVKPSVVFLPDNLFDAEGTLDGIESALRSPAARLLRRYIPDLKFAAVVQGLDVDEWIECFDILNDLKGIDILGIPMLTTELFGSRVECLNEIAGRVKTPCHLLGVWKGYSLDQVRQESEFSFVMGIDTSKPVRLAVEGKGLDKWLELNRDRDFIDRKHNSINLELLRSNCKGFVDVCREK